uniref:Uncharacterized protein n=1 Tax=Oryza brachyantha TaxID=4533 RepID=J3NAT4_ORYBR
MMLWHRIYDVRDELSSIEMKLDVHSYLDYETRLKSARRVVCFIFTYLTNFC